MLIVLTTDRELETEKFPLTSNVDLVNSLVVLVIATGDLPLSANKALAIESSRF